MEAFKAVLEAIISQLISLPIKIIFKVMEYLFKWTLFSFLKSFELMRSVNEL